MSITRSYNKSTNTYYAYKTEYIWDEVAQKKVQRRQCIGKYDPETDEIIPTGKRGRPRRTMPKAKQQGSPDNAEYANILLEAENLSERLKSVETSFERLSSEVVQLSTDLDSLLRRMKANGNS